jgi:hypothetical protein
MTFSLRPNRRVLSTVAIVGSLVVSGISCSGTPTGIDNSDDYELEIRYVGTPPSGATLTSFQAAYAKIDGMVTAKLSAVNIPSVNLDTDCGLDGVDIDVPAETVTGLIVYIQVVAIDGPSGTLGSAGPCLIRPVGGNSLPALGVMQLDVADVANLQTNGRLTTVVHHELLHVLGLGTMWAELAMLSGENTVDSRYLGARARTACANVHGGGANCATNVPVHSDTSAAGAGSSYAHWRESLFTNELMTPFLNSAPGATNPYSVMTVEAMGDLGYPVSTTGTDAFTVSGTLLRMAPDPNAPPPIAMPAPREPRWTVDENGRAIPLRRQ